MCTNFLLTVPNVDSPDPAALHVSARCLELAGALATNLYTVPRAQKFPLGLDAPPANVSTWQSRYGFVGVAGSPTGFAALPCFMDGLNEAGLSAAALWLPGTEYPASGSQPNVSFSDLVAWMLGNFASVDEIAAALPSISVIGPPLPADGEPSNYVPLHFIATDATGASLVLEFLGGTMHVHRSDDGVLTNAPPYPWQRMNLDNYAHLDVVGPATSIVSKGPPVGSGLLGLPGDSMSASRFVKAATLRRGFSLLPQDGAGWLPAPGGIPASALAPPGTTPTAATPGFAGSVQTIVNVAMQLVQVIQATPYGTLLEQGSPSSPPQVGDWTMWSIVRDHTHRTLYYTTAFNGIMRAIDLTQLDFGATATFPAFPTIALLPSPGLAWYEDATTQFSPASQAAA